MTYIGQQPATTFDSGIQDRFTGLSTNTVTLTHEISAEEDILVVWNNIVQDKNTYSCGGTGNKVITLGGTLSSSDVVTVYYLNKVMQSVNPTAGSVTSTTITDDIISGQTALGATPADTDELLVSDAGVLKRVDYSYLKGEDNTPYWSAHGSATQTVATSTDTTLQFNQLLDSLDSASGYDTSAYTYTVQSGGAGLWYLKAGFYFSGASSFSEGNQVQIKLQVDSNDKINSHVFYGGQTDGWLQCDGLIKLAVGNVIKLNTWQNTGGNITVYNNNAYNSQLSGFRIKAI